MHADAHLNTRTYAHTTERNGSRFRFTGAHELHSSFAIHEGIPVRALSLAPTLPEPRPLNRTLVPPLPPRLARPDRPDSHLSSPLTLLPKRLSRNANRSKLIEKGKILRVNGKYGGASSVRPEVN